MAPTSDPDQKLPETLPEALLEISPAWLVTIASSRGMLGQLGTAHHVQEKCTF